MSPDTKALVDAIDSLKHTDSFLKSYIYPLLPAIISTLAGYFIALFNFNRQQNKTSNDNKVKDVNKFLIEVQSAFISLIEEKKKYQFLISNDPQPQNRLVQIREINTVFPDVERIENMVFLGVSCQNSGWSDMSKINRMVWGYKKVVSLISKRNEIRNEIFKRLKYDKQNNLIYDFTPVDVQPYYQEGMKVTEAMIKSIDDVLIDMSDFLDNINISINIALPLNSDDIILPNQMRNQNDNLALERICSPDFEVWASLISGNAALIKEAYKNNNLY